MILGFKSCWLTVLGFLVQKDSFDLALLTGILKVRL